MGVPPRRDPCGELGLADRPGQEHHFAVLLHRFPHPWSGGQGGDERAEQILVFVGGDIVDLEAPAEMRVRMLADQLELKAWGVSDLRCGCCLYGGRCLLGDPSGHVVPLLANLCSVGMVLRGFVGPPGAEHDGALQPDRVVLLSGVRDPEGWLVLVGVGVLGAALDAPDALQDRAGGLKCLLPQVPERVGADRLEPRVGQVDLVGGVRWSV